MIGALAASPWSIWGIAAVATAGVIVRPFVWPEFIWADGRRGIAGRCCDCSRRREALAGVAKGTDVYLFLIGMMLLAELARQEGLFDWLAAHAARLADGSATRLFALVYGVGIVVTVFLSNDATAVVLTPAVAAVAAGREGARAAALSAHLRLHRQCRELRAADLQPGEPGDLRQPHAAAAAMAAALCAALGAVGRRDLSWCCAGRSRPHLRRRYPPTIEVPTLSAGGHLAAWGHCAPTAVVLLAASAVDLRLGLPTFLAGAATAGAGDARSFGADRWR